MMTEHSYQAQKALLSKADIDLLKSEGFDDCTDFRNYALTYAYENADNEVFEIHCGYGLDNDENLMADLGLVITASVDTWKNISNCLGMFNSIEEAIYAVQQHDIYKQD